MVPWIRSADERERERNQNGCQNAWRRAGEMAWGCEARDGACASMACEDAGDACMGLAWSSADAGGGIDLRLVGGSAVFGLGWGIAGFCPGAALPALGTGKWEVVAFIAALVAGIWVARLAQARSEARVTA